MGSQISGLFGNSSTTGFTFFFVQTSQCHELHHPRNIPDVGDKSDPLTYRIFPSPDGDQSSQQHGSHTYIFCETADIHQYTYSLLTCDVLVCCYLPHQKREMIAFMKEQCVSFLHESAPIILWEMPTQKRVYPSTNGIRSGHDTRSQSQLKDTCDGKSNGKEDSSNTSNEPVNNSFSFRLMNGWRSNSGQSVNLSKKGGNFSIFGPKEYSSQQLVDDPSNHFGTLRSTDVTTEKSKVDDRRAKMQILVEETPSKRIIILLKGGEYPEFLQNVIKAKFINKFAEEKKKLQKGVQWQYFDKDTYIEFEKKILRHKKVSNVEDEWSDDSSEDSENDIETFEEITEYQKDLKKQQDQVPSDTRPSIPLSGAPPPPPPPMNMPPPPPLPGQEMTAPTSKFKKLHWKNIDPSNLEQSFWTEVSTINLENLQEILEEKFLLQKKEGKKSQSKKDENRIINIVDENRARNIEIVMRGLTKKLVKLFPLEEEPEEKENRNPNTNAGSMQDENSMGKNGEGISRIATGNNKDSDREEFNPEKVAARIISYFPILTRIICEGDKEKIFSEGEWESIGHCMPIESDLKALAKYKETTNFLEENISVGDKWLLHSLLYPELPQWIQAVFWMRNINSEIEQAREMIELHLEAQKQLRESSEFKMILRIILIVGNTLNQGSVVGSYKGFSLESLSKVQEVSSERPGYTLLHFIVEKAEEFKICPGALTLQLNKVKEAANLPFEMIDNRIRNIANCARFLQSLAQSVSSDERVSRTKSDVMKAIEEISRRSGEMKTGIREIAKYFAQKESEDLLLHVSRFIDQLASATPPAPPTPIESVSQDLELQTQGTAPMV